MRLIARPSLVRSAVSGPRASSALRSMSSSSSEVKREKQYTHGHQAPVVQSHARRTAEEYASHVLPLLTPGTSILDVGCGPGSITKGFKKYVGPSGSIVGIDVVPEVLKEAAQLCGADAVIRPGDVYNLGETQAYDVVHAHQVLQHLGDPLKALLEMKKASKKFVCVREVDYESWIWHPEDERLAAWKTMYRSVCKRNGANPDIGRSLRSLFQRAGFKDENIQVSAHTCLYATSERTRIWGDTWHQRTGQTKLADQAIQFDLAKRPEIDGMAQAWKTWGESPDATMYYVDVAVVARI